MVGFSRSCLNIGAGYDLQPLMRFAHMTDTFLYTNVYLPQEGIEKWYNTQLKAHKDFEIFDFQRTEEDAASKYFEPWHDGSAYYIKPQASFADPSFLEEYSRVFRNAAQEPRWLLYWKVLYKPLNKVLHLYYYNGEGVATYHYFDPYGLNAPRILITIQTGFLEYPERHFDAFFENALQPSLWVRGFDPDRCWLDYRSNALRQTGLYDCLGMNFTGEWTAGDYDDLTGRSRSRTQRYCKGLVTTEAKDRMAKQAYISPNPEKVLITRGRLRAEHINIAKDYVILPSSTKIQLPEGSKVIYWEGIKGISIEGIKSLAYGAVQLVDALHAHLKFLEIEPDATLHVLPACVESQGKLHLEAMARLPWKSMHYAPGSLDFFDSIEDSAFSSGFFTGEEIGADKILDEILRKSKEQGEGAAE